MTAKASAEPAKKSSAAEVTDVVDETYAELVPSPSDFAKYEKVVPGGAVRVLEMAEKEAEHRRAVEHKTVETELRVQKIGLFMGFILALGAGVLGGALLLQGSELAGLMIVLADIIVVGATVLKVRLPQA